MFYELLHHVSFRMVNCNFAQFNFSYGFTYFSLFLPRKMLSAVKTDSLLPF